MQTDGQMIQQARRLFEQGDYAAAEQAYRDLIDELPEHKRIDLELIIATCQQAQGRHDDALETLRRAVEHDDARAESWFQLGRARRLAGDEKGATEALQRAIVLDPNHALARVERARQCQAAGDTDSADAHLRTALRADPDCVPALVGQAERHIQAGALDKAQELAARAVQHQPHSVPAQIVMARVFRHRGHPDFAERCLDNALESAPRSAELYAAKAQLLFERGRLEECLEAIGFAGSLGGADPRLFRLEFQCLRELGRLVEARRLIEALSRSQPLGSRDTLALAELRLDTGDPAAAAELLERLDEAWPAAGQWIRARLAEREGQRERATELAGGLLGDDDEYLRDQARLQRARLALMDGDAKACIDLLEPLTAEGPAEPKVHWMLARALDETGRHEEAGRHLPQSGWFVPPILRERDREMPKALYDALDGLETAGWETSMPGDDGPRPVFVLGWPGGGREVLVAALADSNEIQTLGRDGAQRRREALGLPAWPQRLGEADEAQRRLARRRYLREADRKSSVLLESMWLPVVALPAIARFLPGSTVVVADADLRDLELEWRLAGFRGIDLLSELWQREQAALEKLMDGLPLDFQVVSRSDLETDPSGVAEQLGQAMGLADTGSLSSAVERHLRGLRPSGHWKHYRDLFEGRSAA